MKEKIAQLDKLLLADASLFEKIFSAETAEEVQGIFKVQGLEFTFNEIDILRDSLVKQFDEQDFADGKLHLMIPDTVADELSDTDLENVAGGAQIVSRGMIAVGYGIPFDVKIPPSLPGGGTRW